MSVHRGYYISNLIITEPERMNIMDTKKLDAFLDRLTSWRIPGNDCIIIKDGETLYRHFSGYAEIETEKRIQGDETYNMWSISKLVTVVAVMTLLERGDILLTDPVSEYLPEYADVQLSMHTDTGERLTSPSKKINIYHLLTMSAGFSYDMNTEPIRRVREATDGCCPTREVVRAMAQSPLQFEPGEHWLYSICHDILAGLVEVIAGERYSDYVRRVIFEPLGMSDSTFAAPPKRLIDRMARQYSYNYNRGRAVPTDNSVSHRLGTEYESGGAGMTSTVEDYVKFAYMLANGGVGLNGERIISARTVDLIRTNAMSEQQMKDVDWPQLAGYGYGLGVRTMVSPIHGGSIGPVGEFGWSGAAGSWTMIDPELHLAVFYAQHMLESQESYITARLRNLIYSSL